MKPLEPNDPLWKLLGQSREVEARPNFVQNVARAARHAPQERGWWARWRAWWDEGGENPLSVRAIMAVAAVVVTAGWVSVSFLRQEERTLQPHTPVVANAVPPLSAEPKVVEGPLVPEVEAQLESLDYLDALLALDDTSAFTDKEIAYLLY